MWEASRIRTGSDAMAVAPQAEQRPLRRSSSKRRGGAAVARPPRREPTQQQRHHWRAAARPPRRRRSSLPRLASPLLLPLLAFLTLLAAAAPLRPAAAQAAPAPPAAERAHVEVAAAPGEVVVHSGEELGEQLAAVASPGPALTLVLHTNVSMTDVPGPRPLPVARALTIRGSGAPEHAELNLDILVSAWQIAPGASVTLQNLTLSNLAPRPPSARPPPPANASAFTFPLWFFASDRSKSQIILKNVRLVIPYDEFLILHHVMIEWETGANKGPDMYTYFEDVLRQNLRDLRVSVSF